MSTEREPWRETAEAEGGDRRAVAGIGCVLFAVTFLVLFLAMPRNVGMYDEGITLTGAMRVMAGQIPHRDFYANYGPAEFYSFALLFKIFGQSVLAERLLSLTLEGLTVAAVYAIAAQYCRRWIALGAAMATLLWLYAMSISGGSAIVPVALLNLVASLPLVPMFVRSVPRRQMACAGILAGVSALYRYDTGAALIGIHVFSIAVAAFLRKDEVQSRPRIFISALWPYLAGFFAITLPPALYYLSVAPLKDFVHDILIYPSKYYRRERGLPLPGFHWNDLAALGFYLPIAILGLSLYALLAPVFASSARGAGNRFAALRGEVADRGWRALFCIFGMLSFAMYFKGVVRTGLNPIYLSLLPGLVLLAILCERALRKEESVLPKGVRVSIAGVAALAFLFPILAGVHTTLLALPQRSVPGRIMRVLFFPHRAAPGTQATWCQVKNPVTRGFCFLPDDGRVNTIKFIASHTQPGQTLFVGLSRHDKVFANDNLIYFATQRLPATKWSHFDPGLQNSYEIQQEMVSELESHAPPYIVLDSEFEKANEPNDSSKSTGVLLLDDYIHSRYHPVESFDEMAILQRNP